MILLKALSLAKIKQPLNVAQITQNFKVLKNHAQIEQHRHHPQILYLLLLNPALSLDGESAAWANATDSTLTSQGASVLLSINEAGTLPKKFQSALLCPVGTATKVQLYQKRLHTVQNHRSRLCTAALPGHLVYDNVRGHTFIYRRTVDLCKKRNYQLKVLGECGCLPEGDIVRSPHNQRVEDALRGGAFCSNFNDIMFQRQYTSEAKKQRLC